VLRAIVQTVAELIITVVFGFIGLVTVVGTLDEYRSGRAFNRAMDSYVAEARDEVLEELDTAIAAKADYAAPRELLGKIYIDQGRDERIPKKFAEAAKLFDALRKEQEAAGAKPSLPVLIGQTVAKLESVLARNPGDEERRYAAEEARKRFDEALELYPDSGDLHVNLAAVWLRMNRLSEAKRHLAAVKKAGNISRDALPYLYNLNGLVALREGRFADAVAEFEKTEEFRPGWHVPRLNVASAYARSLLQGDLDQRTAARYAHQIDRLVGQLQRNKHPLVPMLFHALAVYRVGREDYEGALRELREAEKFGELSWHGRFNRAVAQYLLAVMPQQSQRRREELVAEVQPVFQRALRSQRATPRDRFVAAAALGKTYALEGKVQPAVESFETAIKVEPEAGDSFIPEARLRVYRSLAAVAYEAGDYAAARTYLEKSKELPDPREMATRLLGRLTTEPTVSDFSVKLGKIATDYDVRISATVAATATPEPLTTDHVRLTLVNTTDHSRRAIPFELVGNRVHALLINLPQGAHRIECQVTDAVGNRSEAAVKTLRIDREAPRVRQRKPEAGATVDRLTTVRFHVFDALGSVDFETLAVMLKYPKKAKAVSRFLVTRGKYVYDAPDGSVQKGTAARDQVTAPVPPDTVPGTYSVLVRVRDLEGRLNETEWSFDLR
jgi:tetratricopeptide (TPR) repeat protein